MDTRNKERIVGAIALVAIVVIVVPELLTGQRAPPATAPSSGGTPITTVSIDLGKERGAVVRPPPPAATSTPPTAPAPEPRAVPTPAAADAALPETETASASAPADSGLEPAAKPAPAPAPASVPAATAPARAAPVAAPQASVPAGPPRPRAAPHGGEQWVVQLGSFKSRENAERLATGLKAKGYSAFVSEFRGSNTVLFRVRVGPEQDRARADAIAQRLARDGHKGSVAPEG